MQLLSKREPTNFKVVPKNKKGSSAIEVVIPKVSKGAQKLKKIDINDGGLHRELSGCAATTGSCGGLPKLGGTKVKIISICVVLLSLGRS